MGGFRVLVILAIITALGHYTYKEVLDFPISEKATLVLISMQGFYVLAYSVLLTLYLYTVIITKK